MITIHEKTAQKFDTLGLGALLPGSCVVTEEINGSYELKLSHPYDEGGKWKRIERGRILYASTPRGMQPFRIYNTKPNMSGIEVNARHIFYDLLDNQCNSISYSGTAVGALQAIQGAFAYAMPFTFTTDISTSGTLSTGRMNPIQALLSDDDETTSFVKGFGGEILRDHFNVSIKTSMGQDRDVAIRYGKNLIGLEVTQDESDVKTRIQCYGKNGSATVDSPYLGAYLYPKIHTLEDENKTVSELREEAQALLDSGVDIPLVNIKVDFIPLSKTVEYKNYAILEDVQLGDIVTVIHNKMNFSKRARVISYEWDCILEQYNEVELGDFMPTLASSVTSGVRSGNLASAAVVNASAVMAALQSHLGDYQNPHRVTAAQTGGSGGTTEEAQEILYGTATPNDADGKDGDAYVQMAEYTEYTPVEYIESYGNQFIDTLLSMPYGFHAVFEVMMTSLPANIQCLIGSHETNAPYYRNFFGASSTGKAWEMGFLGGDQFGEVVANSKYTIDVCNISGSIFCKVNDIEQIIDTKGDTSPQRSPRNLYILGMNYTGGLFPSHAKLYWMKIYSSEDDSNIVRDFIPVKDASGVACLYDNVSQDYFYNAGTGTFTAGAELPKEAAGGALYIKINGTWKLAMRGAA